MFYWMRNTHLALGLTLLAFALMFAVSSLKIAYRDFFPDNRSETTRTATPPPEAASDGRSLALYLMETEGLRGELRRVNQNAETISVRIARPGAEYIVDYSRADREASIVERRYNLFEMLVQLHVNHGFWHEYWPSQLWALMTALTSFGLLALGATGIYLWFAHRSERRIGAILLGAGLLYGLTTLIWTRL